MVIILNISFIAINENKEAVPNTIIFNLISRNGQWLLFRVNDRTALEMIRKLKKEVALI